MAVQSLGWDASLARSRSALVAFHGFVGNWDELRESHGLRIDTGTSHAEIVAAAFDDMEERIVPLLRGEFAIIIHDLRRNRVLAARDVLGCRPLYIRNLREITLMGSEIRQVVAGSDGVAKPNPCASANILLNEPAVGTETLVAGVESVMPGEIYSFCRERTGFSLHRKTYWRLEDSVPDQVKNEADWLEELERRIKRAVQRWLPGHPSALTLSGGLDSSALWAEIVALRDEGLAGAASVRPVSMVFPGFPCDERAFVETTLQATGDQGLMIDGTRETAVGLRQVLLERLDTVQFSLVYLFHMMAEAASKDGRKTLITGHLGDHLFDIRAPNFSGRAAGSLRIGLNRILGGRRAPGVYSMLKRLGWRRMDPGNLDLDLGLLRDDWQTVINHNRWNRGLRGFSPVNVISRRLMSERTGWLIQSWEQICAWFGVEVRHPFSDPDLIAWAASAPKSIFDSDLIKPMLREVYRQRLPRRVIDLKHKSAFRCLIVRDSPALADSVPPTDWYLVASGIIDDLALDRLLDAANNETEARIMVLWIEALESCVQMLGSSRFYEVDWGTR